MSQVGLNKETLHLGGGSQPLIKFLISCRQLIDKYIPFTSQYIMDAYRICISLCKRILGINTIYKKPLWKNKDMLLSVVGDTQVNHRWELFGVISW